ncbi:MAG: NAD-dependent epimerase/dehydratase family protein [Bacteroidales bacterium]|nr:NAD-dependent epimerase/dehydratase family protein [Bacteroidales bacterium]
MKLLIIGSDSFIARHFIKEYYQYYQIRSVSRVSTNIEGETVVSNFFNIPDSWFQDINVVINFAAIVHNIKIKSENAYDLINNKLAVINAEKAKKAGASLFIQISSIAVYGNQSKINVCSKPDPKTPYGYAKLKADENLVALQDWKFKVSIIRLPMVYGGTNTPGNMARLIRLSKLTIPLPFKNISNFRDFIHVRNFIQYLSYIITNQLHGIYLLSDQEPVSTAYLIKTIAEALNKNAILVNSPVFLLKLLKFLIPSEYDKLFGSLQIKSNLPIDVICRRFSVKEGIYEMIRGS